MKRWSRCEVKKRKEFIESFEKGGRQDLLEKEQRETILIEQYFTPEMSDEELFNKVKAVANTLEDKNFGVVMKATIVAINGQTDGKCISVTEKALEIL